MVAASCWLCDRTQGFTIVRSSSLAGLAVGLSCRELTVGVLFCAIGWPILDLLRTGLTVGLFWVFDRGRAVFLGIAGFFVAGAGVFSGVIDGVTFPAARRTAYGSAVAGLFSSGRRIGRRTVPLINEPVLVGFFNADLVDSPDIAEGGRAVPDDGVEVVLVLALRDFDVIIFTGE